MAGQPRAPPQTKKKVALRDLKNHPGLDEWSAKVGWDKVKDTARNFLLRAYTLAEAEETMVKMLTAPPYGLEVEPLPGYPRIPTRPPGRPEERPSLINPLHHGSPIEV